MLLAPRAAATPGVPERLSYYKCNLNSIVGDDVEVPWPVYTSRLDIEPELAVVYGNPQQPVAGYCIFNDVSARDRTRRTDFPFSHDWFRGKSFDSFTPLGGAVPRACVPTVRPSRRA